MHVEFRVHAGCDLFAPRQRKPNMHAIVHAVCAQRCENRLLDLFDRRYLLKGKCMCRVVQPLQVAGERSDTAAIDAQAFPNRIATLYRAVKNRNLGLGAWFELTIDVDLNIGVAGIRTLHGVSSL